MISLNIGGIVYLKRLTLRGFKTFADKTILEFPEPGGIAAIVGPNGCGKSNIVDALRWVLGEGNLKEIRSTSLEEVIFAGSTARKPLSLAEVMVDIENSDKALSLPYSEVSIKRRIFRSAESEFFINKNPCRLKDIRDLFLDTGLGDGSYSIINQGQVDAILSSNPSERRAPFEEAAQISKYKLRRVAAERKLIATEQNLLRISDLKTELERGLTNLDGQAKKARDYKEKKEKLKILEIGIFKRQAAANFEKEKNLEQKIKGLKIEEDASTSRITKLTEERDKLRGGLRSQDVEIEERFKAIKNQIFEKERERGEVHNKVLELEGNEKFIKSEINHDQKYLEKLFSLKGDLAKRAIEGDEIPVDIEEIIKEWKASEKIGLLIVRDDDSLNLVEGELKGTSLKNKLKLAAISSLSPRIKESGEDKINDEITSTKQSLDLKQRELEEVSKLRPTLGERADSIKEELKVLEEKFKGMEEEAKLERLSLIAKIEELETELKDLEEGRGRLRSDIQKEEISLAKLEGELSVIESRIKEEYNLTLKDAMSQEIEIPNLGRAKAEAEELKFYLRSLEPVNLLAIEEFEKINERYTFIESQYNDLISARENLASLIAELDKKAKESFLEVIKIVSQNFSEIFSNLFEGGEAKLMLIEGEDPLNAGIEILARPHGRKWLPLPLLSGGERALTAIAILFALLKTHPSPFCFLDEVDAALDEVNIYRFTKMLRTFASNIQIVVITHSKRTMAIADVLYGITMEEPGISKLVSMKLAQVA